MSESLGELQSFVVRSFTKIANKQLLIQNYPADPIGGTKRKTVSYIVPITKCRSMTITWVVPDHRELYYCNSESYLAFLIHHEGVGSILHHLKRLGLATELFASGGTNFAPGFNFFVIDLELTIDGLERWQDVAYLIYQYMTMIRKEEPKEWIFHERKDYPLTDCLFGNYDMREFRPDLIRELLDEYLIPSKMRIFPIGEEFTTIATEKEKWYGTQYKQEYLCEEFIRKCETCDMIPDIHMPLPNDFIPTDFRLYHNQQ
ncbi:unnamed protein product, partial [Rotaria sordida]